MNTANLVLGEYKNEMAWNNVIHGGKCPPLCWILLSQTSFSYIFCSSIKKHKHTQKLRWLITLCSTFKYKRKGHEMPSWNFKIFYLVGTQLEELTATNPVSGFDLFLVPSSCQESVTQQSGWKKKKMKLENSYV